MSSLHPNVRGVEKKKNKKEEKDEKSIERTMIPPPGTVGKKTELE